MGADKIIITCKMGKKMRKILQQNVYKLIFVMVNILRTGRNSSLNNEYYIINIINK